MVGPLVALAAVVALIAGLLLIGGKPNTTAASNSTLKPGALTNSGFPHRHRHHQAAHATVTPTPASTPTSAPSRSTSPTSHPSHAAASPGAAMVPVAVLNNSRVSHLAATAASQVAAKGWPISTVGNFTGRLPQTTLFYEPGQHGSARLLAGQFAGIASLEPRPSWLPASGLTLVVTRYWES